MKRFLLSVCLLLAFLMVRAAAQPKREFRGAWIQCVNGQYIGKTSAQVRQMLSSQLDVMQRAHINAVFFQVRAECDALYRSHYEPWSRFLTGTQGKAPADGWDPLAWMIEQCHSRGMECHAWINPYRAKTKFTTALSPRHVAVRHKERVFEYDGLYILNPALEVNRMYTCMVVEDILLNYNVDGIHMDDYFYPYPAKGLPLQDQVYFDADARGFDNIADWRRDNVNLLIRTLHDHIRSIKPWVKFGVSPFGIYRNSPSQTNSRQGSATRGTQNYDDLYADVVLWQEKGWVDYLIPQIYWNIGTRVADYEVLCRWWNDYCHKRPLFVGQDVERTVQGKDPRNPRSNQTAAKYDLQRSLPHLQGSCQWYAAAFVDGKGGYRDLVETKYFKYPALQPLMPFIDKKAPKKPRDLQVEAQNGKVMLTWKSPRFRKELDRAVLYVVYDFARGEKINLDDPSHILTVTPNLFCTLPSGLAGHTLVVTALDRLQNESKKVSVRL